MSDSRYPPFGTGEIRADFVPASDYLAPEVEALEEERLWPRIWHITCRAEEIPNVGDFVNYRFQDESILIVRSTPDEIKAFYNVCQHRGRRLRTEDRGNLGKGFFCRYHGWRYGLDGALTHVHDEEDWADCPAFAKERLGLKAPQVGQWAGWVWINMDPDAQPLLDWLQPIVDELENFDLPAMRFAWHEVIHAPVNWKVIVEAFNEGYHASATHRTDRLFAGPVKVLQSSAGRHGRYDVLMADPSSPEALADPRSFQELVHDQSFELHDRLRGLVMEPMMNAIRRLQAETSRDDPPQLLAAKLWDFHKEALTAAGLVWPERLRPEELATVAGNWHIFPNTIMLPSIDGVLWYRMRPGTDRDSCVFDIWCLRPFAPGTEPKVEPRVSHGFAEFAGRNPFMEQDFDNLEEVNEGMKSRGWTGAVFNPVQEGHMANFHRLLRDYLLEVK